MDAKILDDLDQMERAATQSLVRVGELPQNQAAIIIDVAPGQIIEVARFSIVGDAPLYSSLRTHARPLIDAAREAERLRAIVERLPKTADGCPITPGRMVWYWADGRWAIEYVTGIYPVNKKMAVGNCGWERSANEVFSTREAAIAAKEARNE